MEEKRVVLENEKEWSFNIKFTVNKLNLKTFEEFKHYSKTNSANNYLLAIQQLLLTNSLLKMFMEQENERIARKDRK